MQILFLLAVLPSIYLGLYIYKHDTVEKESKKLLTLLFLGGILAIPLTLFIEMIIIDSIITIDKDNLTIFGTFLFAFYYIAAVEEGSKWIFLKTFSWKNKEFNHLYDGLIYAAFVALGFATLENILYVFQGGVVTGLLRAVTAVPGHFFDGIFMGYFFAKAKEAQVKNESGKKGLFLLLSYVVPVVLHGAYDFLCMVEIETAVLLFLVLVIILYIASFSMIKKLSKVTTPIVGYNEIRYPNQIINRINKNYVPPVTEKINYYCGECGTKIDSAKYCPNCGTKRV